MNAWRHFRVCVIAVFFAGGLFGGSRGMNTGYPLAYLAGAVFLFGVIGMLFVIGIQAVNPRSDAVWERPNWISNPFKGGQPLQFFYFGGYFILAGGIGGLLRSAFVSGTPIVEPVVLTCWGAGMLLGVWVCTQVFRFKMPQPNISLQRDRDR
jgi:hypothetical protein